MDPISKKRKPDERNAGVGVPRLTLDDARKFLEPVTRDQLLDIVVHAMCREEAHGGGALIEAVRSVEVLRDPSRRKLFVRGLGWETTRESLCSVFSQYGDLEEAVVIFDKVTGRSKGYGFVTFRHADCALLALKEPSKKIDSRVVVTQLAAAGASGGLVAHASPAVDISQRKIYVGNVPPEMPSDRLLAIFSAYGEIEEGPLGFDKQTGKSRGYALFVYKTVEGAKASLVDPMKHIDGYQLVCKLAYDGKKGKAFASESNTAHAGGAHGQPTFAAIAADATGDGLNIGNQSNTLLLSQFGGASSLGGFYDGPFSGGAASGMPGPAGLGGAGAGGFGGALGGPYGSSSQFGRLGMGGYGGFGVGSSLHRIPPSSLGLSSGGFTDGGHYGLPPSTFQSHAGSSPGPKVPGGRGMYRGLAPYH